MENKEKEDIKAIICLIWLIVMFILMIIALVYGFLGNRDLAISIAFLDNAILFWGLIFLTFT